MLQKLLNLWRNSNSTAFAMQSGICRKVLFWKAKASRKARRAKPERTGNVVKLKSAGETTWTKGEVDEICLGMFGPTCFGGL